MMFGHGKYAEDLAYGDVVKIRDHDFFVSEVVILYPGEVIIQFQDLEAIPGYDQSFATILSSDHALVVS